MLLDFFIAYGFWIVLIGSGLFIIHRFIDHFFTQYIKVQQERNRILGELAKLLKEKRG
ncbi:hypothetical protein [Sphingobacterium sp. LRF_L2]|uniref:hypothetical protein n=1 Tax=Sphingobacterium sp. LRF_L2 TaxID=3369421 RepID=UPI003F63BB85